MRGPSLKVLLLAALTGLALPAPTAAQEASRLAADSAPSADAKSKGAVSGSAATTSPSGAGADAAAPGTHPPDAAAALVRAAAAYEYGDMNQVVEASRPVADGLLPATPEDQLQALRLLGIGLYLTSRPLGAEAAFTELLRKDSRARLDPTSTRPELVAFFEGLRHQQMARQRSTRKLYWNFLPPVGQFQNDDNVKGWVLLGVGAAALATSVTTAILLKSWEVMPGYQSTHTNASFKLKTVNWIAVGVLAATYVCGVVDGLVGYGKPIDEGKPSASSRFTPRDGGLGFTF